MEFIASLSWRQLTAGILFLVAKVVGIGATLAMLAGSFMALPLIITGAVLLAGTFALAIWDFRSSKGTNVNVCCTCSHHSKGG